MGVVANDIVPPHLSVKTKEGQSERVGNGGEQRVE